MSEKIARLKERLGDLLSKVPEDADFTSVTDEQLNEVRDLFDSILLARFPSVSWDSVPVEMHLINRTKYRAAVTYIPSAVREIRDTAQAAEYAADLARAASSAASITNEVTRLLAFHTNDLATSLETSGERARDLSGLEELIRAEEIEKAEAERDRLLDKYAPNDTVPDDLARLIEMLGQKLDQDRIDAACAEIEAAIDAIEPLVGQMIPDDRRLGKHVAPFAEQSGSVWRLIRKHKNVFGRNVLSKQIVRFNQLVTEDRGTRLYSMRKPA